VFVEGTRSRTREMQQTLTPSRVISISPTLGAARRHHGTEEMFPIGEDGLHQVTAIARSARRSRRENYTSRPKAIGD